MGRTAWQPWMGLSLLPPQDTALWCRIGMTVVDGMGLGEKTLGRGIERGQGLVLDGRDDAARGVRMPPLGAWEMTPLGAWEMPSTGDGSSPQGASC